MSKITATIDDKTKTLRIEIALLPAAQESSTGKMDMIATSGGFQDLGLQFDGKPVRLNVMAGVRK